MAKKKTPLDAYDCFEDELLKSMDEDDCFDLQSEPFEEYEDLFSDTSASDCGSISPFESQQKVVHHLKAKKSAPAHLKNTQHPQTYQQQVALEKLEQFEQDLSQYLQLRNPDAATAQSQVSHKDYITQGATLRDLVLAQRLGVSAQVFFNQTSLCPLTLWFTTLPKTAQGALGYGQPAEALLPWILAHPSEPFEQHCLSRLKSTHPNFLFHLFSQRHTFEACAYLHQHTHERMVNTQKISNTSSVYLTEKDRNSALPLLHSIVVQAKHFEYHYTPALHLIGTYYDSKLFLERDSLGFTVLGCINRLLKNSLNQPLTACLLDIFHILTHMGADPTALHPSLDQISSHPDILKLALTYEQKKHLDHHVPLAPLTSGRVKIPRL